MTKQFRAIDALFSDIKAGDAYQWEHHADEYVPGNGSGEVAFGISLEFESFYLSNFDGPEVIAEFNKRQPTADFPRIDTEVTIFRMVEVQ